MKKHLLTLSVVLPLGLAFPTFADDAKPSTTPAETPTAAAAPAPTESTESADKLLVKPGPPFQEEAIEWDAEAGHKIHFPEKGEPTIILSGKVREGHTLSINDSPVEITDGRFSIPIKLTESLNEYTIKLKIPEVGDNIYRFTYGWKKLPPEKQFKVKIREGDKVVEKATAAVAKVQESDNWVEQGPTITRRGGRAFFRQFEASPILILDRLGGLVVSLSAGWAPEYRMSRRWTIGGGLGVTILKNQQQQYFPAFEYRLSVARKFGESFEVELLGGAQSWFNVQGFIPMFGVNFLFPRAKLIPDWPLFKLGRKIYVGYSYLAHSSQAHMFKLGLRLAF